MEESPEMAKKYIDGVCHGMNNMKKFVLQVFEDKPNASKEEIKKYIKENL